MKTIEKIQKWVHALFVISIGVISILEMFVLQSKIKLFTNVSTPLLPKWIIPILGVGFVCVLAVVWFWKLGLWSEYEELDEQNAMRDLNTKQIAKTPLYDIMISYFGIIILEAPQDYLASWSIAQTIYSYSILWIYCIPFISCLLELIHSFTLSDRYSKEHAQVIQKYQLIDGIVCSVCCLLNLFLLVVVTNMSVCWYTYQLYIVLIVYRIIRYYHLSVVLWCEQEERVVNEIDQKEGIL